jgi:hypothetical protein
MNIENLNGYSIEFNYSVFVIYCAKDRKRNEHIQ